MIFFIIKNLNNNYYLPESFVKTIVLGQYFKIFKLTLPNEEQ